MEKKRQMGVLEQRIIESGEASIANASVVDMQQVVSLSSAFPFVFLVFFHLFIPFTDNSSLIFQFYLCGYRQ